MLTSFALLFLFGLLGKNLSARFSLPGLLGMMIAGMLLGPHGFSLLDDKLLNISPELRKFALIIILTRAGLSLDIDDLKYVGRPAFFLCFIPATFELLFVVFFAPTFFGISRLEAVILGTVLSAVSLAVIVPKMVTLIDSGYGERKKIPHLILASASIDNIYIIILFTSFLSLSKGGQFHIFQLLQIPISILLGILVGYLAGELLHRLFTFTSPKNTVKILLILSVSFLLTALENRIHFWINFSSLLSIMTIGITLNEKEGNEIDELADSFQELWIVGEILLFTLVGSIVDLSLIQKSFFLLSCFILIALGFRMLGAYLSTFGSNLIKKERLFIMLSYTPKATVQAAIGGIPLSMGLACGQLVLTVAVLSILITAPLGAFAIERSYSKLLEKE